MRKYSGLLFKFLVIAGAFFYLWNIFDSEIFYKRVMEINTIPVFIAFILHFIFVVATQGFKLKVLVPPVGLLDAAFISIKMNGYNAIFPARAGDIYRLVLVAKKYSLRKTHLIGRFVLERFIDVSCLVIMAFLLTKFYFPDWISYFLLPAAGLVLGLVSIFLILPYVLSSNFYLSFEKKYLLNLKLLKTSIEPRLLFSSLCLLDDSKKYRVLFAIFLNWGVSLPLTFYFLYNGLGMNLDIGISIWVFFVSTLGFIIPSGPGGAGAYHFALAVTLQKAGMAESDAAAYAILIHFFASAFQLIEFFVIYSYEQLFEKGVEKKQEI